MHKVGFWGCGNLAKIIAEKLSDGTVTGYQIVGAYDIDPDAAGKLSQICGSKACGSMDELIELMPEYIIEAVSPVVLKKEAFRIIRRGINLIVLSCGAMADDSFASRLAEYAEKSKAKVYLASGAIGGFDIMGAARLMGNLKASVINEKSPEALNGAPYLKGRLLDKEKEELLFYGTAREAIDFFPQNLNVAVAAATATSGVDNTSVCLKSVPGMALNTHIIELEGNFGNASLKISSYPSANNAKSSEIAAWSVLYILWKLRRSIVFY